MITKVEIDDILGRYEKGKVTIGTLGSHSALNIFKGAKEEDFGTICVCKKGDEIARALLNPIILLLPQALSNFLGSRTFFYTLGMKLV